MISEISKKLPLKKSLLIGSVAIGIYLATNTAFAREYTIRWGKYPATGQNTVYSNVAECESRGSRCKLILRRDNCGVNLFGSAGLFDKIRRSYRAKKPIHVYSRTTNQRVCAWFMP